MRSPSTTLRSVKRMTKYNELKAATLPSDRILENTKQILSIKILPQINIYEPQVKKPRNLTVSILPPTSYIPKLIQPSSLPTQPISTQDFLSLLKSQEQEQVEIRRQEREIDMLKLKQMLGVPP